MVSSFCRLVATVVATEKNSAKFKKIILRKKLGKSPENRSFQGFLFLFGGDKRDRTADLLNAIQALSQLSYTPKFTAPPLAWVL